MQNSRFVEPSSRAVASSKRMDKDGSCECSLVAAIFSQYDLERLLPLFFAPTRLPMSTPSSADSQWFVSLPDGRRIGPATRQEIALAWQQNKFPQGTLVEDASGLIGVPVAEFCSPQNKPQVSPQASAYSPPQSFPSQRFASANPRSSSSRTLIIIVISAVWKASRRSLPDIGTHCHEQATDIALRAALDECLCTDTQSPGRTQGYRRTDIDRFEPYSDEHSLCRRGDRIGIR